MCDDTTERENLAWLAQKRLGRREFGVAVGATAALLVSGCRDDSSDAGAADGGKKSASDADAGASGTNIKTKSSMVDIKTPDGTVDAYFVHPESGSAPAVIMWPDILGLRDAFKTMATRLAGEGYAVLVVNQFYRTSKAPILGSWEEWMTDAGKMKLQPMIAEITPDGITSDAAAFVEWLDDQDAVNKNKKIGTAGYCMGGPYTFRTAASKPERVGAFASLHGAGLVTEMPDSPHLLLSKVKASALIAIATTDDMQMPDAKTTLKDSAAAAKVAAEIEVYPAAHGWCAIDSMAYDQEQADKAFARMLVLYKKL